MEALLAAAAARRKTRRSNQTSVTRQQRRDATTPIPAMDLVNAGRDHRCGLVGNGRGSSDPSMAGGSSSAKPAARGRKRVEATTVLKRSRDGSAFTRCEACNKDVPIVLIDMHSCSLDSKIRMTLEAQVVEKTVEITKAERKRPAASAAKGNKAAKRSKEDAPKRKRPPTAFFLFMEDFRKEYKAAHPDNKSVSTVAKEGGEKWRSMTEEEKKPYIDKAAELKAHVDNGEGSGENNVAVERGEAADDEEQEVDQPADEEEEAGDQEEEEKNELDDDM